jgi:ribonucleoside-diphosphate reductase alpha subunit
MSILSLFKRNGKNVSFNLGKLVARLTRASSGLDEKFVDPFLIAQSVNESMTDNMTTRQLDELAEDTALYKMSSHPDYGTLAARIAIGNLQKDTCKNFSDTITLMRNNIDTRTKLEAPLISQTVYEFIQENKVIFNGAINHERDFLYDYFGFKTLFKQSYLSRVNGKVVETPQFMHMRVACGIHCGNIKAALESYELMSNLFFTHASPTLFNAGSPKPQMSSCFLLTMKDDSIDGIYDTLKQAAKISKYAGGIGIDINSIRASGSYIRGTSGTSNGIIPMLKVYNATARYVDQGGGKRKGAFATYLEPWHADIEDWLILRSNNGKEEFRARDLFLGLWIPDLFMRRVKSDAWWTLMCPNECKGLVTTYGEEFDRLYEDYELKNMGKKRIKARDLFTKIINAQEETGNPYMMYKDACNRKSNQQNLGTIRCSNLCTEIVEYTSPDEIAVCNLASISLRKFVKGNLFDFHALHNVVKIITRNLNKVIDVNYYPVKEAEYSNLRHRPIGIGVQGLAETFFMLRYPFDSDEARKLNVQIFETILFSAYTASNELAMEEGKYTSYEGSPASKGILHFDMCQVTGEYDARFTSQLVLPASERALGIAPLWDWVDLRKKIDKKGLRNSLLVAPMPTQSTSQVLGNTESFEPIQSNLFTRRTLSGEYVVLSKHLVKDLIALGKWHPEMKQRIIAENGSIQKIKEIPEDIKKLYRTVWEIKQRSIVDMAADRYPFIDQSQSLNIHMADVTHGKLTSCHFHGWSRGLKTGMYYLRTKPAADAIKFTLDTSDTVKVTTKVVTEVATTCSLENKEGCISCGS